MHTKESSSVISQPGSTYIAVSLEEGGYLAQCIETKDELNQAFRLRKKVFCDELGWVKPRNDFELDGYDLSSVPFGVFYDGRLEAYLRLIPTVNPFMLEDVFPMLIGPDHKLRKESDTAEITRLCIEPEARKCCIENDYGVFSISLFLYKSVYHWCLINKVRYLYLVVEYKIFRLLNLQGIICSKIGETVTMPDGVKAVAAIIDWRNVEAVNSSVRPKMAEWFTGYLSFSAPKPQPQPEISKLHPTYV